MGRSLSKLVIPTYRIKLLGKTLARYLLKFDVLVMGKLIFYVEE